MSTFAPDSTPDFAAINAAHQLAEELGWVDPNSRPTGTMPLDAAYEHVELGEWLKVAIAAEQPPVEATVAMRGCRRRGGEPRGQEKSVGRSTGTNRVPNLALGPVGLTMAWFDGKYPGVDAVQRHDFLGKVLRATTYAKGYGTSPTATEIEIARQALDHDKRRRRSGNRASDTGR